MSKRLAETSKLVDKAKLYALRRSRTDLVKTDGEGKIRRND